MIFAFSGLSIKSKLQIMLLTVSLGSILVIGYLGWSRARSTIKQGIFNHLTSVRTSKAYQIESYFENLRHYLETLCEDRMVVSAMVEFNKAYRQLNQEYIPLNWNDTLKAYYEQEFFPKLSNTINGQPNFETYRPAGQAARYLQYHYIAKNPYPLGKKDELVAAKDESQYSKVHSQYHPLFRNLIKRFGYYDFFLINFKTGDIVYSVYKETDFATNLDEGAYRKSNLAQVVKAVRENPDRGAIQIVDFQPYRPSYNTPAAFLAGPIYNGPHIIGILAIQLPVDEINKVLTDNKSWQKDGLGKTGQVYLVGADYLMRSVSRFLIEDPKKYENDLRRSNIPDSTIQSIQQLNTSILLQKVDTEAAREAISGKEGTKIVNNYRRIPVLTSYSPLKIQGVEWGILAEMDLAEAYQPVYALQLYLLISTVILMLVITLLANVVAQNFAKPIYAIIEGSRKVTKGELDIEILVNSNDELNELAQLFNTMVQGIHKQAELLERKNYENELLLLNTLPRSIVERLKKGEKRIADQIPQVTVLFASIIGFHKMTDYRNVDETAQILNELIDAFDETAQKHDVERIKSLAEHYIAVCGLTTSRLDHTKRMVDFALDTQNVLQSFNNRYDTKMRLTIGIHTGAVMAGIIGTKKFMYYIWGETVTIASYLNNQSEPDSITVTQDVYDRLHNLYDFERGKPVKVDQKEVSTTWVLRKRWLQGLINELLPESDLDF